MSEVVKIVRGEVISLKKDSEKTFEEFNVEKDGAKIGSRFVFKVQTRVNDRADKSPRLFRRCSYFVKTAEDIEKTRKALNLGAVLDIDGQTNRRSFKDKKSGDTVWIDEVDVRGIAIIQPSINGASAAATGNDDLPF